MLDAGGGLVGGVTTVLQDINVDPATIERIVKSIRTSNETLDEPLGTMDSGPMQGCDGGETFTHHAELARTHMREAMKDMVTGLIGIEKVAQDYGDVQQGNDAESAAAGYKIKARVDASENCFTPPTPEQPGVCSPSDTQGGS